LEVGRELTSTEGEQSAKRFVLGSEPVFTSTQPTRSL